MAGKLINRNINATEVAKFVNAGLALCRNHPRCNELFTGAPLIGYVPPRLWDVRANRLVDTRGEDVKDQPYTALSYCWGRRRAVPPVQTTQENLAGRRAHQPTDADWPATYRRAFEITEALEIQYIWIDALCIVQNNKDDVTENFMSHVHQVYQNAQVTICAVVGGAEEDPLAARSTPPDDERPELPKIPGVITPRLGTPAIDIGGETTSPQPFWATRGWTFQERTLPAKCIFLAPHQLYWECRQNLIEEGGMMHLPTVFKRPAAQNAQGFWPAMVREYSRRQLGYYQDKVPAILGIANQLKTHVDDQFPVFGFLAGRVARDLLWESAGGPRGVPLTRLMLTVPEIPKVDSPYAWSWAFWNGTIDFESYLENATLQHQTTYSVTNTGTNNGTLWVSNAMTATIGAGMRIQNQELAGQTDIIYTVVHQNLFQMVDLKSRNQIGWCAFDRDPERNGANWNEKNEIVCLSVSHTSWATKDKIPQHKTATNVLMLNSISHVPEFGRIGVAQIWDNTTVAWQAFTKAPTLSVRSPLGFPEHG